MLQEKIVKEEMIFIQPHIKLMCDLLAERNKKDMFDPVVGQIMRIYGYFVMKKVSTLSLASRGLSIKFFRKSMNCA